MKDLAFWEVPGFWPMLAVLILLAAAMALCIAFGPTEAPYEAEEVDAADVAVKTEWGISLTEWNALTDQDRAYYRHNVSQAKTGGQS